MPAPSGPSSQNLFGESVSYGEGFLTDYVGPIVTDARIAIAELIANAHDGGATLVEITWPKTLGEKFLVRDNGSGLTREQFEYRWRKLGYNRLDEQGEFAEFPPSVKKDRERPVFGKNGKGRFAPFFFADQYQVETSRDGKTIRATVKQSPGGASPFEIAATEVESDRPHGTTISWDADRRGVTEESLAGLIRSTFVLDPQFTIKLNDVVVDLASLEDIPKDKIQVPGVGTVTVAVVDTGEAKRHNRPGVAWRVGSRLVGEPGWKEMETEGRWPNGRPAETKRFCFVVDADVLKANVKPKWDGFYDDPSTSAVKRAVGDFVYKWVNLHTQGSVLKSKKIAILANAEVIRTLPALSKKTVGSFITEVRTVCPRISQTELNSVVQILAKLEQARSGYNLLQQLADMSPKDLDSWSAIMKTWQASDAEAALSEVDRRLQIIAQLERIMSKKDTDEVHELLPLFGQGLWIFGPMYETVEYRSNRTLVTVLRDMFGGTKSVKVKNPANRPDVVATPSGYLLPFSMTGYNAANGETDQLSSVLLLELKKGGFTIDHDDLTQAKKYVAQLRKGNHVGAKTAITSYVLGWHVDQDVSDEEVGKTEPKVYYLPKTYGAIVETAKSRMLGLAAQIKKYEYEPTQDAEVTEILSGTTAPAFA